MSTAQQFESWEKTIAEMGDRTREVVKCLRDHPAGMSCWEIADQTKRLVHAVRPRITELFKAGWVRQVGERWERRTGRNEAVWRFIERDNCQQMRLF